MRDGLADHQPQILRGRNRQVNESLVVAQFEFVKLSHYPRGWQCLRILVGKKSQLQLFALEPGPTMNTAWRRFNTLVAPPAGRDLVDFGGCTAEHSQNVLLGPH
jgi:hypothetical protein